MKVVIIHTDFRIYWPARIKALHAYLQSRGIELTVVEIAGMGSPYAFVEKEDDQTLKWHILFPSTKMENLKSYNIKKKVYNKLNELNADVIIAGAIAFPSGALATAWAKKHQKKIIVFDDAKIEDVRRSGITNFIKQSIYNCVDAMLYPSADWEKTGLFWKFKKEQLFYGIDVVDNSFWQQTLPYSYNHSTPYFLSIGRQIPVKNYPFILKAYKLYREKTKESAYDLVLIGDGPERSIIEEYIQTNNLERVFLKPFMQQKELIPIYRQAEAFILASTKETWGLVLNEAMANGIPVISSINCGATNTLINEGINGYTFSPFNEQELADIMVKYHTLDNNAKLKMKSNTKSTIRKWDLNRFVEGTYQAIQYSLQRNSHQPSFLESFILKMWKGKYNPI